MITARTTWRRVDPPDPFVGPADLIYDPCEPYEVLIVFAEGTSRTQWTVDRALMVTGLGTIIGAAGIGDTRFSSTATEYLVRVISNDVTDDGYSDVTLAFPLGDVAAFLGRTIAAVPFGSERLNWPAIDDEYRSLTENGV